MLLATFQPILTDETISNGGKLGSNFLKDETGYNAPIWCYPAEDLGTLFALMQLSAPSFPEEFTIFETDNYRRVDRVGWYECLFSDRKIDGSLLNPDLPDIECEFLTDASCMENSAKKISVPLVLIPKMLEEGKLIAFTDQEYAMPANMYINSAMIAMETILSDMDECLLNEETVEQYGREIAELEMQLEFLRTTFTYFMMPIVWAQIKGKKNPGVYSLAMMSTRNKDIEIYDEFEAALNADVLDKEKIRTQPYQIRDMVITDEQTLLNDYLEHCHKIRRNDPCPCCSGKKYKNCCGKK